MYLLIIYLNSTLHLIIYYNYHEQNQKAHRCVTLQGRVPKIKDSRLKCLSSTMYNSLYQRLIVTKGQNFDLIIKTNKRDTLDP